MESVRYLVRQTRMDWQTMQFHFDQVTCWNVNNWFWAKNRRNWKAKNFLKYTLTRDNHFKFGYDGSYFVPRSSVEQKWSISYGHCRRTPNSFRLECLQAAREIAEKATFPIYVCLSGGIDSEIVAESFRLAGIPFVAGIMRFNDNLNRHDILWALKYCIKHNVEYRFFDVNVFEFYESSEFKTVAHSSG